MRRTRVPVNIGQGFLRQAIDCGFHRCGSFAAVRDFDFDLKPGAVSEATDEILQGSGKAICSQ